MAVIFQLLRISNTFQDLCKKKGILNLTGTFDPYFWNYCY